MRSLRRMALAVLAAVLLPVAVAGTAEADSYRFWGYYQWADGEWAFAPTGPADTTPEDGAIEGWRFAVGGESATRFPRTGDVFEEICGGAAAEDSEKRVAVVIDYGTPEDAPEGDEPPAPRGECAVVADDASGSDVLAAVAQARFGDGGLMCGIDGYPSSDCGGPVDGPAPTDDETAVELVLPSDGETSDDPTDDAEATDPANAADADDDGGSQLALGIAAAAVVLIGIAAVWRMRRSPGT
ncbi:hypothetical protein G1H11_23740 [Phytoactinopolyspora alkaliphila]|uniref:Uncharacterized protein n=1 Tax=Phytoactinopolyspora alkaliphila TaxID=1783498 RepID=A0A6N9YU30_9ACTN|nr:SCO2322 family protein [Phytoactinopolyspora alkaliphila]NED98318.1 hypothetical protein [Phytoactinopolyspora alkaliphila]